MTVFPEDKTQSGPHFWHVLFNLASQYPDHPTRDDKLNNHNLIKSIISKFTCQDCIQNAFDYKEKHPINLDNKEELMKWLCGLKNNANEHSGKEEINCDDFVLNSLNKTGGCKTCTIDPIKAPNLSPPKNNTPLIQAPKFILPKVGSVLDWEERYPSLKRSFTATESFTQTASPSTDLESRYPSLAPVSETLEITEQHEEELDGILKPLDGIYGIPAGLTDLKPSEINLAYTPEMATNLVSLLMQMYMTNAGSLVTTVISSLGLLGVSIFAKGSLSRYDRLFLQNLTGSMLFHTFNFINPRIKDEVMGDLGRILEGVTTMDFDKVKSAVLFSTEGEKSNKELMSEMIDMEKLGNGRQHHGLGFAGEVSTVKSSVPDLRVLGGGGIGAPLSRHDIEGKFNSRSQLRSPLDNGMAQRNTGRTQYGPDLGMLDEIDDKYAYILDNQLF